MNANDHREKIIELLEVIGRRPAMYFGSEDNVEGARTFLWGFNLSLLRIFTDGPMNMPDFYETGHLERGWSFKPMGPEQEMRERGLSDKEIVVELVVISISGWKRFFG